MSQRLLLAIAGIGGAMSAAIDAAARHLLAADPYRLELATTSARYGLVHAAALVGLALWYSRSRWFGAAGWCFAAGLALFCGSLDAVALGGSADLVVLTPWGGTAFILGWLILAMAAWRMRPPTPD